MRNAYGGPLGTSGLQMARALGLGSPAFALTTWSRGPDPGILSSF